MNCSTYNHHLALMYRYAYQVCPDMTDSQITRCLEMTRKDPEYRRAYVMLRRHVKACEACKEVLNKEPREMPPGIDERLDAWEMERND